MKNKFYALFTSVSLFVFSSNDELQNILTIAAMHHSFKQGALSWANIYYPFLLVCYQDLTLALFSGASSIGKIFSISTW